MRRATSVLLGAVTYGIVGALVFGSIAAGVVLTCKDSAVKLATKFNPKNKERQ